MRRELHHDQTSQADQDRLQRKSFAAQLPILFLVRTVINASHRIIYPFLPSIARGLGVSLTTAGGLITLRLAAGMAAPFLGPLADRQGRRRVMELALLAFTLASLLLAGVGTLPAAALAFALYGISKVLYDPAVHAYVGDSVPYRRRGWAIGIVELSWSSAWLLGVPATGFLIERLGWRAPWAGLAGLGLLSLGLTRTALPPIARAAARGDARPLAASLLAVWHSLLRRRHVVVLLLTASLLALSNEIPFIVYGPWLEETFGLDLTTLGLASTVVGLAEATAEVGTSLITDRLGKRRSVLIGLLGLAVSLAVLLVLRRLGLGAALLGVALMFLAFEFSLVSLLTMATELAPEARASLLSLIVTAFSLSRIGGTFVGTWLWRWHNMGLHAALGIACALVAALLLGLGAREVE
jgi:predicted MFS family arabinose efflux permease